MQTYNVSGSNSEQLIRKHLVDMHKWNICVPSVMKELPTFWVINNSQSVLHSMQTFNNTYIVCMLSFIVQMSVTRKARWGDSLTAVSLGPGLTEVVEFGGSPDPWTGSIETQPKMADTTLLQFSECPHNLSSSSVAVVCVYTPTLYLYEYGTLSLVYHYANVPDDDVIL